MRRRDFLGAAAGTAFSSIAAAGWAVAADGGPKRLIGILLRGAVDGLNVVVPYAEEAYYQERRSIAIAQPGKPDEALTLDEHFGLHPALASLMPMWTERSLAFIHAAGSPDPTRSHFDAQLFIENGTPGERTTRDGWMNRLLLALRPTLCIRRPLAAGEQVEDTPDDSRRIGRTADHIDPRRFDHRTCCDAFTAARAAIENVVDPTLKGLDE
jgi:uncharacterized protein (DUF1501 family)